MAVDAARSNILYHAAAKFADPAERAAFLKRECADDSELLDRVEAMFQALDTLPQQSSPIGDTSAYSPNTAPPTTENYHDPSARIGAVIAGKYTLVEVIGEGGMGQVFMALQTEPVKRSVAVKVIKAGMDSKAVLARFEAERQALALMDHPNIAKVLDAGATEDGRPFFVMELVKGMPITQFCDDQKLSLRRRLELFVSVCHAIQHAHQKGVIHRDIKPSNILVTLYDDRPVPKVIDFGVAKATGQALTDNTLMTGIGALLGTPEYMSPEQAGMNNMDIDTRSDVYSLGVVLYELLTGTTPVARTGLPRSSLLEILRIVREVDPAPPSSKLTSIDELPSIASARSVEPGKLAKLIRGELDWIVLKALEKDRSRRYDTANGLARDLQRYLANEVVEARPPSTSYRLRKFFARHRGQVIAAGLVAAALVCGMVGTTIGLFEARRQEARAQAAALREQTRADELKEVADFQAELLANLNPNQAGLQLSQDVISRFKAALAKEGVPEEDQPDLVASFTAEWRRVNATDAALAFINRTILAPAVSALDRQFKDQPAVDAQLRQTLAKSYSRLGLIEAALPLQREALAVRRRVLGNEHHDTLNSMANMAHLLKLLGKLNDAETLYRETLETAKNVVGEESIETLGYVGSLGDCLREQGRYEEAEPLLAAALDGTRNQLGAEHIRTLIALNRLGQLYAARKEWAQAERLWREAYETGKRVLDEDSTDLLIFLLNLAGLKSSMGDHRAAEPLNREAAARSRRLLGEEHPSTITATGNLASSLREAKRSAEAAALFQEASDKARRVFGEAHHLTLNYTKELGKVMISLRRLEEADAVLRDHLATCRRLRGAEHPDTMHAIDAYCMLLTAQGKYVEAEPLYRELIATERKIYGEDHPDTLKAINSLGVLYLSLGKPALAEPHFREALERGRRGLGPDHPDVLVWISNMGSLLQMQDRFAEAQPFLREAHEKFRQKLGEEHPNTIGVGRNLGLCLRDLGELAEAENYLADTLAKRQRLIGPEHPETVVSAIDLASVYNRCGRHAEAVALLAPMEATGRKVLTGRYVKRLGALLENLGRARTGLGEFTPAEANLLEAHDIWVKADDALKKGERSCCEALADLYSARDRSEPGKGYDAKAAAWKAQFPKTNEPPAKPERK